MAVKQSANTTSTAAHIYKKINFQQFVKFWLNWNALLMVWVFSLSHSSQKKNKKMIQHLYNLKLIQVRWSIISSLQKICSMGLVWALSLLYKKISYHQSCCCRIYHLQALYDWVNCPSIIKICISKYEIVYKQIN